jgi:hypothetical protein
VIAGQMEMFLLSDVVADQPVFGDTVCRGCGATWRVPVNGGPGGDWNAAVLFGYVELKAHERAGCPGDTAMARAARRRLMSVWPVHEQVVPGTVRYADLVTSTWDARAALMLALGHTLVEGQA